MKIAAVGLTLDVQFPEEDIIYPCGKTKPYKFESLKKYNPDYIFIQNPYHVDGNFNDHRSFEVKNDENLSLTSLKATGAKIMYILYGPSLFHQSCIYDSMLSKVIDTVFVDSYITKEIYKKYCNFSDEIISNIKKIIENKYLPFDEKLICKTFRCKMGTIKNKIFGVSYSFNRDEFKKMLDLVDEPAKFISNYLLNLANPQGL